MSKPETRQESSHNQAPTVDNFSELSHIDSCEDVVVRLTAFLLRLTLIKDNCRHPLFRRQINVEVFLEWQTSN